MKKLLGVVLLAALLYLLFWPVAIEPEVWQAPDNQGYVGDFDVNTKLERFDALGMSGDYGPEAVVTDAAGILYAATHQGWIVRWLPGSDEAEKWVEVGGRPLGLDFDQQGDLWIANAYLGLMKVTPAGVLTTELSEVEGKRLSYPDDVVVANNGKIYFSDASTKFAARIWGGTLPASLLEILEHAKHGRIIEYDPVSKISRVVMKGLSFSNGVTTDPDGQFLLVVETGEYRVWKYWLVGDNAGRSEVIIDNLPGFPDNIHRGQNGRYWVGLAAPRMPLVDKLDDQPFVRKVIQRLPSFIQPELVNYGLVFAIDERGNVVSNLQAPSGKVYTTTGALETSEYLYVSSLTAPFLARYLKTDIGLK